MRFKYIGCVSHLKDLVLSGYPSMPLRKLRYSEHVFSHSDYWCVAAGAHSVAEQYGKEAYKILGATSPEGRSKSLPHLHPTESEWTTAKATMLSQQFCSQFWSNRIQSIAFIMRSNIVIYYINNYRNRGRISIRCWIHKWLPITRPNRRTMVYYCEYLWENWPRLTAPHCITHVMLNLFWRP